MAKHLVPFIPMFGSLENVSGNSAECGHKGIVKICASCHNNKDILHGITKFNARRGNLYRLKLQARLLAGNDGDDIGGSSDDEEAHLDATTLPCLVALRYPIWRVTQRRDKLYTRLESFGKKGKGRQQIDLHAVRIESAETLAFPNMMYLPLQIAHFAFDYLHNELGLRKIEERDRKVDDINSIRLKYIASNPSTGTHIQTHGGIALESDITAGVVRVRARPYANDTWFGKNPQDAVMMVPGLDRWKGMPEDFDIGNPEHEKLILYAKVVLFFRIRFKSTRTGYDKVHNLCLIEELLELKIQGQGGCREAGISMVLFGII
jgi:hypothetical protein